MNNNQQIDEPSVWMRECDVNSTRKHISNINIGVEKLTIRLCDVDSESVSKLSKLSHLRSLKIINSNVKTSGLISLTNALIKGDSSLQKFYIEGDCILSDGTNCLADALRNNNSLRDLSVADNGLTSEDSEALAEALHENSVLQKFNIRENTVCNTGASIFAKILVASNTSLSHINLSNTGITHTGMIEIFEALAKNSTLQSLSLNHNDAHEQFNEVLVSAAETLEKNKSLTSLELGNCNKQSTDINAGLKKLLHVLSISTTLRKLKLCSNSVDDVGAKILALVLGKNDSLTKLDLRNNVIGDDGAVAIALALNTNSTLSALYLSGNYIGYNAATFFASALKSNTTLQQLKLSDSDIQQIGVDVIAEALCENVGLTKISLKNNGVTNADAICALIQTNETLQTINLWENDLTSEISKIENVMQENFVLTCLNIEYDKSISYRNITNMLTRNEEFVYAKRLKKVKVAL